jgi:hypothetical protein
MDSCHTSKISSKVKPEKYFMDPERPGNRAKTVCHLDILAWISGDDVMSRVHLINQRKGLSAEQLESPKWAKKQHALQAEIMSFIETIPFSLDQSLSKPNKLVIPDNDVGDEDNGWLSSASDDEDDEDEGEDENDEDEDNEEEDWDILSHPEDTALPIPSRLGPDHFNIPEIRALADEEVDLRVEQASGALEALRVALGLKSAFIRKRIRGANTQHKITRAWRAFGPVQAGVIRPTQDYRIARQALVDLGASADVLAKFPPLRKEDCKMGGDVEEENRVGQRSDHVSWIWRVNNRGTFNKDEWQQEGDCFLFWCE